jgi:hypothetical protein
MSLWPHSPFGWVFLGALVPGIAREAFDAIRKGAPKSSRRRV